MSKDYMTVRQLNLELCIRESLLYYAFYLNYILL